MGGFGSGRPGGKQKAEHCRSLDVNKFRRAGCLAPGYRGGWQWTRDGETMANIGLEARGEDLHLTYRIRVLGGEWEDVAYTVPLTWRPCTKGGQRPYFVCPGSQNGHPCQRRATKLYGAGRYFLCRHCHRLAYQSQSETPYNRLFRRANKLRRAMGGEPGMASSIPSRRKGQWRRTYEAQVDEIYELEFAIDAELEAWIARRFPGQSMRELLGR
jgi:hypothetical protein